VESVYYPPNIGRGTKTLLPDFLGSKSENEVTEREREPEYSFFEILILIIHNFSYCESHTLLESEFGTRSLVLIVSCQGEKRLRRREITFRERDRFLRNESSIVFST